MTRRLTVAAAGVALAASTLAACTSDRDERLVGALRDASAPALFAPSYAGHAPRSFVVNADHSVTLAYGTGFTPTLTLRKAPPGDLCAGRAPEWDRCQAVDGDVVRLGFEEMNAVIVRRAGTELFWSNISFEMPDEDFTSDDARQDAIDARVSTFVRASQRATQLSPGELVDRVPKGTVKAAS